MRCASPSSVTLPRPCSIANSSHNTSSHLLRLQSQLAAVHLRSTRSAKASFYSLTLRKRDMKKLLNWQRVIHRCYLKKAVLAIAVYASNDSYNATASLLALVRIKKQMLTATALIAAWRIKCITKTQVSEHTCWFQCWRKIWNSPVVHLVDSCFSTLDYQQNSGVLIGQIITMLKSNQSAKGFLMLNF